MKDSKPEKAEEWREDFQKKLFESTLENDAWLHINEDCKCQCYIEDKEIELFIENQIAKAKQEGYEQGLKQAADSPTF